MAPLRTTVIQEREPRDETVVIRKQRREPRDKVIIHERERWAAEGNAIRLP